jgi:hypothetical protein
MTRYEMTYEQNLRTELAKAAEEMIQAGQEARKSFAEKMMKSTFTYAAGWDTAEVVAFEVDEKVGYEIRQGLGHERAPLASEILETVRRTLTQIVGSGLSQDRPDMIQYFQARQAHKLLDESASFNSLGRAVYMARATAEDELFEDELKVVRAATRELADAKAALPRARTDAGRAKIQTKIEDAEVALKNARLSLDYARRQAGAPVTS